MLETSIMQASVVEIMKIDNNYRFLRDSCAFSCWKRLIKLYKLDSHHNLRLKSRFKGERSLGA
jgi:hypothetical protein